MSLQALISKYRGLILPVAVIACIAILLTPLPAAVLDVLLAANLAIAVIILLTTISVKTPLEFSVFPSLLVATTLGRLVLNVGTTRLILTRGAQDRQEAAGGMIQAFADFVAGDMLVVGIVIFAIIAAIQFLVITKGATRVGEVAARFALDGMPGRQMAIDADLNAGQIDGAEAQRRRAELAEQADFYGAMDGASKFIRGDAIAAILITVINIVAGFMIGMTSGGMSLQESAEVFTRLTIGDGLVSQLPAFLISLGAAVLVTRSQKKSDLSNDLLDQLFAQPQTLAIAGGFLVLLIFTNLPTIPLLILGSACAALSYIISRSQKQEAAEQQAEATRKAQAKSKPDPTELLHVDALRVELGSGLIPLALAQRGGDLMERIGDIRNHAATEMGFLIPQVRLKDNLSLGPTTYSIQVAGNAVATGEVYPNMLLAFGPDLDLLPPSAVRTQQPGFAASAAWITPEVAQQLTELDLQLWTPSQVLAHHFRSVTNRFAQDLLTREQTNQLLQQLKKSHPAIVEELVPEQLTMAEVQQVLHLLLDEGVPIRQLAMICEALSDGAMRTKNVHQLAQLVRERLARTISQQFSSRGSLQVLTLSPQLEDRISQGIDLSEPEITSRMAPQEIATICEQIEQLVAHSKLARPIVLARPNTRAALRWLTRKRLPQLVALSHSEITLETQVQSLGTIGTTSAAA